MFARKFNDYTFIIDLKPKGLENYIASYVLRGTKANAIIETGPRCSIPNLLKGLLELGIEKREIDYLLVSHVHIDHAGGAGTLIQQLPNAKLIVHSKGAPHMIHPEKLWAASKQVLGEVALAYQEIEPVPANRVIIAVDSSFVDLGGGLQLKVIETLGHASHHLAFFENLSSGIFHGDAAGIYMPELDVTIPTTPDPLDLTMTYASIQKLIAMNPKWLYYTHFGPASNAVNRLKAYIMQIGIWKRIVSEALDESDSLQVIYDKILEYDSQMKVAAKHISNHFFIQRGVIMQNIQGVLQYLKKIR